MTTLKRILKSIVDLFKRLFLPNKEPIDVYKEEALLSPGKVIARRFIKNKLAVIGIIGFVSIFLFSFGLSLFVPLNLYYTNTFHRNLPPNYQYLNVPKQLIKEGIVEIESGNANSIGLSEDGNIFVWGANYRDMLDVPEIIKTKNIVDVSAGSQHLIAVDDQGEIYLWGYNHQYQAEIHSRFVTSFANDPIVLIKGGIERTLAITESGAVYIWGVGANNVGDVMNRAPYYFYEEDEVTVIKAVDVVSNFNNALVLLEDGTVQLIGLQSDVALTMPAELQDGSVEITQIGLTIYNALAVDTNGNLYVWGATSFSLHGDFIPEGAKTNVKQLGVGYDHAVVLTNDNKVYAWGNNDLGQTEVPKNIDDVRDIFIDTHQNFIIHEDGSVTTFGLKGYMLGTDEQGRDFIIQLIHGGKITLTVGAVAVLISLVIGVSVGLTAGYFGGRIDNLLMRFAEIVSSFPFLPFAITLSALLLGGATTEVQRMLMIMVILGVLSWTGLARLIRGQILSERERDYVLAAKALGIKQKHIIWRHIFPAVISIVIVNLTLGYAGSLLTEAGLSFLGFGVQKPNPSWGNILTAAQDVNVIRIYWWRWILPGLAIIIAALSINLIGDALRDAMDPKNAER
ncbi:MAG: ABC transporter permease subunit [Firmicutes bacterium]|nr:ABC transporter permease subunit [Bacillota bacterium]